MTPHEANPPLPLAMVLAEVVHRDATTGMYTLVSTYEAIQAPEFPCEYPSLIVYVALTDGREGAQITLRLIDVDEEGEPVLESEPQTYDLADPTLTFQTTFFQPEVVFAEPGEYRLQLLGDGKVIGERRLLVMQAGGGPDVGPST